MRVLATVAMTFLGSTASLAAGAAMDVQELLNDCRQDVGMAAGICIGVVRGVANVMGYNCTSIQQGNGGSPNLAANIPVGTTYGAMMQIFQNWAEDNPKDWNLSGTVGVIIALRESFPCTD